MEERVTSVAAEYGLPGLLALALVALIYWLGRRMIGAIDKLVERSDANAKSVTDAFTAAVKEIGVTVGQAHKEIGTAIATANNVTTQRLGELSERITRVEVKLHINDPDDAPTR